MQMKDKHSKLETKPMMSLKWIYEFFLWWIL